MLLAHLITDSFETVLYWIPEYWICLGFFVFSTVVTSSYNGSENNGKIKENIEIIVVRKAVQ